MSKSKPKKEKKLKSSLTLISFFIFTIIVMAIPFSLSFKEPSEVYITITVVSILFIFFSVILSNTLVKVLNEYTFDDSIRKEKNTDHSCQYCGHSPAGPFLCGACNSILWYHLKNRGPLLPITVFTLSHRWAILAAIYGAFLLGPVCYLLDKGKEIKRNIEIERIEIQKIQEKLQSDNEKIEEKLQSDNEKSLSNVLNDLSSIRSIIVNLEMATRGSYDMDKWQELNTAYTNLYWNIIPSFEHLVESTCKINSNFNKAIEETKHHKNINLEDFKKKINRDSGLIVYGPAYVINHKDFEITCVSKFLEYADHVYICEVNPSKRNIIKRKRLAKELFHELRTTSIMMRCLIDNKWLLKDGKYPSEAADPAFYFKSMFPEDNFEEHLHKLEFNYDVRSLKAFSPYGIK